MNNTHPINPMVTVPDALRTWARGIYPLEAGVELLVRSFDGRFAGPDNPWVQAGEDAGWWWIDTEPLTDANWGALSGGEVRLLRVAASLLGGEAVNLHEAIPGLDRGHVQLVLAAIAHASGSHEHAGGLVPEPSGRYGDATGKRMSLARLASLYPWPQGHEPDLSE